MNSIVQSMLQSYTCQNPQEQKHALIEIIQLISIQGLSKSTFFHKASFYGGSALRIVHQLPRFSEDLDFTLLSPDSSFQWEMYFPFIKESLGAYGFSLTLQTKTKKESSPIQSAFLKGNTLQHLLTIEPNHFLTKIPFSHNDSLKIKLEIDIDPPPYANSEVSYLLEPIPFSLRCYDLPSLLAGKIHAILYRKWKNRVKGRDYFDYVWFLSKKIPVNMKHLESRLRQSHTIEEGCTFTEFTLKKMLIDRFENVSYDKAKADVISFIQDVASIDLWSTTFFQQITQKYLIVQSYM